MCKICQTCGQKLPEKNCLSCGVSKNVTGEWCPCANSTYCQPPLYLHWRPKEDKSKVDGLVELLYEKMPDYSMVSLQNVAKSIWEFFEKEIVPPYLTNADNPGEFLVCPRNNILRDVRDNIRKAKGETNV